MGFSISPATRGNLASRSPSMPSFAPLTSHCRRGTNTKSAMEGFSVFASHPVAESASSALQESQVPRQHLVVQELSHLGSVVLAAFEVETEPRAVPRDGDAAEHVLLFRDDRVDARGRGGPRRG